MNESSNRVNLIRFAKYRWSADYVTYYCTWFRLFATAVIPLMALSYFNWKVFKYYRDNNFTNAHHVMRKVVVVPSAAMVSYSNKSNTSILTIQLQLESENHNLIEQANDITSNGRNSVGPLNSLSNQVSTVAGGQNTQTNVYRVGSNNMPVQKTISRERTLFLILCCITITFFICHSPRYHFQHFICIMCFIFKSQKYLQAFFLSVFGIYYSSMHT